MFPPFGASHHLTNPVVETAVKLVLPPQETEFGNADIDKRGLIEFTVIVIEILEDTQTPV